MDRSKLPYNTLSKEELLARLEREKEPREIVSFYKYTSIKDPVTFRDDLYSSFHKLHILGRIYLAKEGINAQISVPRSSLAAFKKEVIKRFGDIPFKWALADDSDAKEPAFIKLIVKVKDKIVADGLDDGSFDPSDTGRHLSAAEFNKALAQQDTIVVDMRNRYESEVGHFKKAWLPEVDTFREELPLVLETLKDKKDKKVLLYCTGGIRCEKASAYMKHHGFTDVNQLSGGIIDYARQVKEEGLENAFIGRNFVFDERLSEPVTEDIISSCHQCGQKSARHINCKNDACHLLFIQCNSCQKEYEDCCSRECQEFLTLPASEQQKKRKELFPKKQGAPIRPRLADGGKTPF